MKYLNDYTQLETTKVLNATGAFFAFNKEQFHEQKTNGVRYVNLGAGMVAPKEDAGRLVEALGRIYSAGIAADIKENGLTAIITRELHNHECFYTNDISDVTKVLNEYPGITIAGILQVYNDIKQTEDFSKYY